MKNILPILFGAALLPLAASGEVYSNVGGYTTQTLKANNFNLVGLNMHPSTVAAGDFEAVAGTLLTDSDATFSPVVGRKYVLEITSGTLNGVIQEVPAASISGSTITTPDNLQTLGLLVDDTYLLRLAPTIEEIFGTTTSILSKGPTAGSPLSDIIWLQTATLGSYDRYYIRSTDNTVRNALTNVAAPLTPIIYPDGFFVQKKATGDASLVLTGEVKTGNTLYGLVPGYNLLGTVYPAGSTLQNFGFDDDISKGPTAGSPLSDIVWIPTATPNNYDRYYLRSTDSTWRNALTNVAAPADVVLAPAIYVQRKVASNVNLDAVPPSYYSSL